MAQARSTRLMGISLALALAVLALAAFGSGHWRRDVYRRALEEVERGPGDRALPALRTLAARDQGALEMLAQGAASSNRQVVEAAGLLLEERMAAWRPLPAESAHRRLAKLAELLAGEAHRMSPAGLEVARRVAHEAVNWPGEPAGAETPATLLACQRLLEAIDRQAARQPLVARNDVPLRVADRSPARAQRSASEVDLLERPYSAAAPRSLPAGGVFPAQPLESPLP